MGRQSKADMLVDGTTTFTRREALGTTRSARIWKAGNPRNVRSFGGARNGRRIGLDLSGV